MAMRIRVGVPDEHVTPEVVEPVLEAVTRLNEHMIRTGQSPTSHEALAKGAIWRPENMGDEHFDHGGTIASRGWGDCDDWAPLHAATLRANGTDPGAKTIMVPSGPNTYHAIVKRSDGSIEDPSVAAGMKQGKFPANLSGIDGVDEGMRVWACDPHDGRIYQGALAPTVGPLSLHCGPGLALRGIAGCYEARVDVPLVGSPLVAVRSYTRHRGAPHRRVCSGAVPYAISVSHIAPHPNVAMRRAIVGAICCGDASEMVSDIDRYKLLALQSAMAGMTPGQVHDALERQIHADMHAKAAASGKSPEEHSAELAMQAAAVVGWDRFPGSQSLVGAPVVGNIFNDIGNIASSIVSDVSSVASTVTNAVGPWAGTILHGIQAAVSVIPGLGTAVSDILATAETVYTTAVALMHGNPFEAAIRAGYNFATATIPGAAAIRIILDPIVNTLIGLTVKKEPVDAAVLDGLLSAVPDSPKIGAVSPRTIAASLAHLIVGHLGVSVKKGAPPPRSKPAAATHPLHVVVKPVMPAFHFAPGAFKDAGAAAKAAQTAAQTAATKAKLSTMFANLPDFSQAGAAAAAAQAAANRRPGTAHAAIHKVSMVPVDAMQVHV
jgi:hypothetical protein